MAKKRGQIWVETVIYTLIGLVLIGIVMGIVSPKINQITDRAAINNAIDSLNKINDQIFAILIAGQGNAWEVSFKVGKGEYFLDGVNNKIGFILKDSSLLYSQLNQTISPEGDVLALTQETSKGKYKISLMVDYSSKLNITYNNKAELKIISPAPSDYRFIIENKDGKTINFQPLSR